MSGPMSSASEFIGAPNFSWNMAPVDGAEFSPYQIFARAEWAKLRADTPMTLAPDELDQLSGLIDELSVDEVVEIYLPLSRLLNLHVAAMQKLHAVTSTFLGRQESKLPFILGVAGSVAVGKSTTARVLKSTCWRAGPIIRVLILSRPTASSIPTRSSRRAA